MSNNDSPEKTPVLKGFGFNVFFQSQCKKRLKIKKKWPSFCSYIVSIVKWYIYNRKLVELRVKDNIKIKCFGTTWLTIGETLNFN